MMLSLLFFLSIVALMLPGEVVLRVAGPGVRWGWRRPFVAFAVGQGVSLWSLWLLGLAGVPIWTWGIGLVLASSGLAMGLLLTRGRVRVRGNDLSGENGQGPVREAGGRSCRCLVVRLVPWLMVGLASWLVTVQVLELALAHRIDSVPGMGNWAYKAQVLVMSGGWPGDYLAYEGYNRHMGYPPGLPLLMAWCAAFMGGLESHAIRLLPATFTVAAFVMVSGEMVHRLGWRGLPGVVAAMVLLLAWPGRSFISAFYAEPMLLYMVTTTVVAFAHARTSRGGEWVCWIAAASMAWTKNEGLVLFGLLAVAVVGLAAREGRLARKVAFRAFCAGIAVSVPWRFYVMAHGLSDQSFALARFFDPGAWQRLGSALPRTADTLLGKGTPYTGALQYAAVWWVLPVLVLVALKWRTGFSLVPLGMATGFVLIVNLMMMGSVHEDFEWHMGALPRILVCPSLILLLSYAYLENNHEKTQVP